jgi:hypothetical protein
MKQMVRTFSVCFIYLTELNELNLNELYQLDRFFIVFNDLHINPSLSKFSYYENYVVCREHDEKLEKASNLEERLRLEAEPIYYYNCDSSPKLVESAIIKSSSLVNKPEFILWLG